jgi:hypothetical protein
MLNDEDRVRAAGHAKKFTELHILFWFAICLLSLGVDCSSGETHFQHTA